MTPEEQFKRLQLRILEDEFKTISHAIHIAERRKQPTLVRGLELLRQEIVQQAATFERATRSSTERHGAREDVAPQLNPKEE